MPKASHLIGDRIYDCDFYRATLKHKGITLASWPRKNHIVQHAYYVVLYRERRHIENMLGKLKDWRRIATRYNRCADIFMGAITFAATVIFWLE